MPTDQPAQPLPTATKRPYAPPVLVVHGDVQGLTQKTGTNQDLESAGSFVPDGG